MVASSAVVLSVIAIKILLLVKLMAGPASTQTAAENEIENVPLLFSLSKSSFSTIGADSAS
jgi:hypothetical protein